MIVFLNGALVPEEQALISVFDRGFLYGDGVFETMRVSNGIPFRWTQHWQRLESGARFLRMKLPFSERELRSFADLLIHRNQCTESLLRITLSRGAGVRGYSPKGADHPTVAMSLHAAPDITAGHPPQWRLTVASPRLAAKEALAQYKTCNKLPQILARAEADANGADEALLLNTDGFVVEGASSNLFWIEEAARAQHRVCTPRLLSGILAGVTRSVVGDLCAESGVELVEKEITANELAQRAGVFLSLSSIGIAEAVSIDGQRLPASPLVKRLSRAYWHLLQTETGSEQAATQGAGMSPPGG